MKLVFSFLLFALLSTVATSLRADLFEMTRSSIAGFVISASNIQHSFEVVVRQVSLDTVKKRRKHYYARYNDGRAYVCAEVSILLNGIIVAIPEKAFTDLCFIQKVSAPEPLESGNWMVRLDGGSAGESYKVELIFDDKKLLERKFRYTEGEEKVSDIRKY